MTEKTIQLALYRKLNDRPFNFINTFFFENESDVLSFTSSGYCYEYEIKISRSDFKNDFKKPRFKMLSECILGNKFTCIKGRTYEWLCFFDIFRRQGKITNIREQFGHTSIHFKNNFENTSNRFYYVVPENMILLKECPEFAGLIYVSKIENSFGNYMNVKEIKKAPLLHKTIHDKNKLFNKMYNSYDSVVRKYLQT
jgi:hypothetical protein